MTRDERFDALPSTAEVIAARYGWNYSAMCQLLRVGDPGPEGTRTREMAEGLASEMGRPFAEVWG